VSEETSRSCFAGCEQLSEKRIDEAALRFETRIYEAA
jgi:hypothetical protein